MWRFYETHHKIWWWCSKLVIMILIWFCWTLVLDLELTLLLLAPGLDLAIHLIHPPPYVTILVMFGWSLVGVVAGCGAWFSCCLHWLFLCDVQWGDALVPPTVVLVVLWDWAALWAWQHTTCMLVCVLPVCLLCTCGYVQNFELTLTRLLSSGWWFCPSWLLFDFWLWIYERWILSYWWNLPLF